MLKKCLTNALLYQLSYCGKYCKSRHFERFLALGTHYIKWVFSCSFNRVSSVVAYKIRHTSVTAPNNPAAVTDQDQPGCLAVHERIAEQGDL
jgi:hypothetical protein